MGRHGRHRTTQRFGAGVNAAVELTDAARAQLAEFDALIDGYLAASMTSRLEHPVHDTLGALAIIVEAPTPESKHAAVYRREIERQDNRLPKWLNPDGTLK